MCSFSPGRSRPPARWRARLSRLRRGGSGSTPASQAAASPPNRRAEVATVLEPSTWARANSDSSSLSWRAQSLKLERKPYAVAPTSARASALATVDLPSSPPPGPGNARPRPLKKSPRLGEHRQRTRGQRAPGARRRFKCAVSGRAHVALGHEFGRGWQPRQSKPAGQPGVAYVVGRDSTLVSFSNAPVRTNEQHRYARPLLSQARQSVPQATELWHVGQRDGVLCVGIVHTLKSLAEHSDEIVRPHCRSRPAALDLNEPPLAITANCLDIHAPLPSPRNLSTPTVRFQPPLKMGLSWSSPSWPPSSRVVLAP